MSDKKYHFFWDGPFSQWAITPFVHPIHPRITFNTAEQYMMYSKAVVFGDSETALKILKATTPREQKSLGREVKDFDAVTWNRCAKYMVYEGNLMKFNQHPDLKEILLATGDDILVESSPFDRIWGIGFDAENALANIDKWGTNWLGEVLMRVRTAIK